ncbi:MAG: hypothetical protein Alpg2KO_01830 [Alphaproteobacteria bacterium]
MSEPADKTGLDRQAANNAAGLAPSPKGATEAKPDQYAEGETPLGRKMKRIGDHFEALTLKRKLLTLVVVATMAFVAVLALGLATTYQIVLQLRTERARSVVEIATTLIEEHRQRVVDGKVTEERAKRFILEELRALRVDGGSTYIFIFDAQTLYGVMHPVRPRYEGRPTIGITDADGLPIAQRFRDIALNQGSGHLTYKFPRPEDPEGVEVQKVAFISHYKPWGWIVGTGVYLDDVRSSFGELALAFAGLSALVIFLAVTVTVLISRDIVAPIARLEGALIRLARGDYRQPIPDLNRWDEIGDMARALSIMQGGLDQKARLEEALSEENAKYRRIIETLDLSPEGISIHDNEGRTLYANPAILGIAGYEGHPEMVLGKRWSQLQGPGGDDPAALYEASNRARELGERYTQAELLWIRPDGAKRRLEVRLAQPDEGGVILLVSDRTDALEREAEQERLEAELERSRRTEALGRLAGGIAHDFNNILGAIMGFAEFLVRDLPKGSSEQRYAERILSSSDRARAVIEQVLAHSRAADAELVPIDLSALVDRNEHLLRPLMTPEQELVLCTEQGLRAVTQGHSGQLTQVMLNLVVNARDATRAQEGAKVTLCIRSAIQAEYADLRWPDDADRIVTESRAGGVTALRTGTLPTTDHVLLLEVEDNGPGIPPDGLEHVIEPFNTSKRDRGSSGLGLYVVTGIARAHKGALLIKTRPGHGTTIRLVLPHHPELEPAPEQPAIVLEDLPTGTERILIVDDETDLLDVLSIGLERLGYEVAAISNPEDALEILTEMPDAFDLLVVDQVMPQMRGLELISQLRSQGLEQPMILCTGHSDHANEDSALKAGATAFFHKPAPTARLAPCIRELLDKQG